MNWHWWVNEQPIPLAVPWSDVPLMRVYTSPLLVVLCGALALTVAAAFAAWRWSRWRGPVTFW